MKKIFTMVIGLCCLIVLWVVVSNLIVYFEQAKYNRIIRDLIKNQQVIRVHIINMPWYVSTGIGDPETLDQFYEYHFQLTNLAHSQKYIGLCKALMNEKMSKVPDISTDIRWGCVFYNEKNVRIFSIYSNSFGTNGYFQKTHVSMNKSLLNWLKMNQDALVNRHDPKQKYIEPTEELLLKRNKG